MRIEPAMLRQLTNEMSGMESVCDRVLSVTLDAESPLRTYLTLVQADYYPNASDEAQQRYASVAEAILVGSD